MKSHYNQLACLILAAGLGSRMRPFTKVVPKPLLTVNNEELLGRSLRHAYAITSAVAVNASYFADQIGEFVAPWNVQLSVEREPLGTAGAIRPLLAWLDGRDLLILNGDAWLEHEPNYLVTGWDRLRPRLLVKNVGQPSDFGELRFVGASLLPFEHCAGIPPGASGLYEAVWRRHLDNLDLADIRGQAFDCGTPAEFLAANLYASGGRAVVHPTAHPGGEVLESVFLKESSSPPGHRSVREVRDAYGNVVVVPPEPGESQYAG